MSVKHMRDLRELMTRICRSEYGEYGHEMHSVLKKRTANPYKSTGEYDKYGEYTKNIHTLYIKLFFLICHGQNGIELRTSRA